MEEEIKKRNTDCVYFLASPLTCKKGSECEFRHSVSARLNLRDCYYWLNGICINPNCAFRHPPLEALPEPVRLPSYAATPTSKSSIPCYFYFNAFCIKRDHCPFLHDTLPAQKFLKELPATTTAHPPERKATAGSDTGPASVEVPAKHPRGTSEPVKQELPAPEIALEEPGFSVESSVPEELPVKLSDENPLPVTECDSPQLDQGSAEEFVKECAKLDEWWESSPGFDVLVDGGSCYDDDADYMLPRERESRTHRQLVRNDYDPTAYPAAGYICDHDSHNRAEKDRNMQENFRRKNSSERRCSRGRSLEVGPHRKRRSSRTRHQSVDVRDHTRKRRKIDGGSNKRVSSRVRGSSRERPVHGRMASEVGNMAVSAHATKFSRNDQEGPGYPQSSSHIKFKRRKEKFRRRRRIPRPDRSVRIASKVSRGPSSRREGPLQIKTTAPDFTGPKSLAQIKEEKMRARASESNDTENYAPQHPTKPVPIDFEGPKPLNELLNDKRISGTSTGTARTVTKGEAHEHSGSRGGKRASNDNSIRDNENLTFGYESDFLDEDEIDDDILRRKLADILSS